MKHDTKAFNEQCKIAKKILDKTGINIVTCGECGSVILVDAKKTEYFCYGCGKPGEPCDFPDLFYSN
jgi:hypothetical protein